MSSITFNYLTKEIEMKGPESFIESNLDKIQDLLVERFGEKKKMLTREAHAKANQEPPSLVKMKESQKVAQTTRREVSPSSPRPSAANPSVQGIAQEITTNRPPMRKYIRREGIPGHQRIVVEIAEQKPKELSLAALKEKFGLSKSKIEGVIRDAEKLGKIKRVMNGSYVLTHD